MALSGTFTGIASNAAIVPKIVWSGTQSKDGNYTDVTATLYYSRTDSYTTSGTWEGGITIGSSTTTNSVYLKISYNSNTQAVSATVRVYHNDDGTKSVTISAYGGITGTTLTSTTIRQTVTLDTIPIPSPISIATVDIGSIATININRASSNFTHTLVYTFGTLSGTIATKTTLTSVKWTIPTSFYGQIPSAPSGWGMITCTTYNGGTVVGTTTSKFTVTANKELCAPGVSVTSADVNTISKALTGNSKKIVSGISNLNIATAATPKNSATIASISVYCGSVKKTGANVTFNGADSAAVYVIVTDSRGYSTRVDDDSLSLINYISPTIIHEVSRDTPTGDKVTITVRGKWFNGSFGSVTNTLRLRVAYKTEDATQYGSYSEMTTTKNGSDYNASITLTGLAYTNAYRFQIRLDDAVYKDTNAKYVNNIPLSKGIPVFDWGENDFQFNVPVKFMDGEMMDYVVDQGVDGIWRYRKWQSGIAEIWGEVELSVTTDTAYGNGFYNGGVYNQAFPTNFFNGRPLPVISVVTTGDAQLYIPVISVTRRDAVYYSIVSTKANESTTVTICIRATGLWKI